MNISLPLGKLRLAPASENPSLEPSQTLRPGFEKERAPRPMRIRTSSEMAAGLMATCLIPVLLGCSGERSSTPDASATSNDDQSSSPNRNGQPGSSEQLSLPLDEMELNMAERGDTGYNLLNRAEAHVILHKGTEPPGPGGYTMTKDAGTYICRQCNQVLYSSEHKFESHCGWPSFDDEVEGAVKRLRDEDGYRIEIVCSNCDGHLGHVFEGEHLTEKNIRHCVNSISMRFIAKGEPLPDPIVLPETSQPQPQDPDAGPSGSVPSTE